MRPSVEKINEQNDRKGNPGIAEGREEGILAPFIVLAVSIVLLGGLAYLGGFLISDPGEWNVSPVSSASPLGSPSLSPDASPSGSPAVEPSPSPRASSCPLTTPKAGASVSASDKSSVSLPVQTDTQCTGESCPLPPPK